MGCLLKWSYLLCQPWHTVILPIMHFSQNTFVRVHTGYYYPAQIGRKFSLYWKKIYIYNINNIGMLLWSKLKYPKFTLCRLQYCTISLRAQYHSFNIFTKPQNSAIPTQKWFSFTSEMIRSTSLEKEKRYCNAEYAPF